MALYKVAGLDKMIELPVPLIINLVPEGQVRQRPGYPMWKPYKWIQHETANTNAGADAKMHNQWLLNGGDGQSVSFHFVVDDHAIFQNIPIGEVTWQAADGYGPGNYQCISSELCVNADGNKALARRNAEALCGSILGAIGGKAADIGRHWDYNNVYATPYDPNRHHCPDQMMNEGYWPTFVNNAASYIISSPVPPKYAKPLPIAGSVRLFRAANGALFVPVDRDFTLIADADQRRTAEQSSSLIGPKLVKGTTVRVLYSVVNEGGNWAVSDKWARIPWENFA